MKKYIRLILVAVAALFSLLVFATMSGAALQASGFAFSVKFSTYYLINDGSYGLAITSLVFLIIVLAGEAFMILGEVLGNNKFNHFVALGTAVLAFVGGILFFCFATGDYQNFNLGAGAIMSGLFLLITAVILGSFGSLVLLKKIK